MKTKTLLSLSAAGLVGAGGLVLMNPTEEHVQAHNMARTKGTYIVLDELVEVKATNCELRQFDEGWQVRFQNNGQWMYMHSKNKPLMMKTEDGWRLAWVP
jgi:hypothetical protein